MLPTLPDPDIIQAELSTALPAFHRVCWLEETGSTNADLMALAHEAGALTMRPWLEGAHLQTMGRGRAGRSWQNRYGANLMFSCAFDVFVPTRQLPALSPLAGVATAEALRALISLKHQPRLTMKWPNDILWDGGKLAGILVESTRASTSRTTSDHHVVIVGLGLNLDDARSLSKSLDRSIADWSVVSQQDEYAASHPLCSVVEMIANAWYRVFNEVTRAGVVGLPSRYQAVDGLSGQHIHVLDNDRLLQAGIACGVNENGQLLVRGPTAEYAISVGEISVRARQPDR